MDGSDSSSNYSSSSSSDDSDLPDIADIIAFPAGSELLNFGFWILPNPEDRPLSREMMETIPEMTLTEVQAKKLQK